MVLLNVPPQLTPPSEVSGFVANATVPVTVSGADHDATGVHVTRPAPPAMFSEAPFVNRPVDTAAAPLGLSTTLAAFELPLTGPVAIVPVVELRVKVPAALKTTLERVREADLKMQKIQRHARSSLGTLSIALFLSANCLLKQAYPVPIAQLPVTVNAPVAVKLAEPALEIEAEVMDTVLTDTGASSDTPALLVTVSGTPSAVAGVQLIVPEPANCRRTLPVPVPVLTEAEEVGAMDTVPAAPPLSGPVLMLPPAVIRVNVEAELVTVLASVIAALPVLIEQVPVTMKAPEVVSARLVPIREPEQLTEASAVRSTVNETGPDTVSGALQNATGVHVTVPPPPLRVSEAPAVKRPVVTAAVPDGGAMTTLAAKPPPLTGPVAMAPPVVVRLRVPAVVNAAEVKVTAAEPVLIEQTPETVAAVEVKAKPELEMDEEVMVRVVAVTAASRVTPALLVTVSGTPKAGLGVHAIAPAPASVNETLPEPEPVLTEAAAVGAIDTVPAALPLRPPMEIEPPAVIRLSGGGDDALQVDGGRAGADRARAGHREHTRGGESKIGADQAAAA